MGRWEPNARGRLAEAALDLYVEHGFDQTTVADIAQRAGLTERTFFRHYADKREVLFDQSGALEALLVARVTDAGADVAPIDLIIAALEEAGARIQEEPEHARRRQTVIDANPTLQERELIKLAALASALAEALRQRGVADPAASLTAETGIAVFRVAFERWAAGDDRTGLPQVIRDSLGQLRIAVGGESR